MIKSCVLPFFIPFVKKSLKIVGTNPLESITEVCIWKILSRQTLTTLLESAKLRDLRAKKVLACQRALCAYVLTYLACLRANVHCVLTCQRVLRVNVPTCFARLRTHMPTCLACLRAHVPTHLACLRARV